MRVSFLIGIYRLLLVLAFPFVLLYLVLRSLRDRRWALSLWERLGNLPPAIGKTADGGIWLHAVSVGEVISSASLVKQLRRNDCEVFVSVGTVAGRAIAEERLGGVVDGIFYVPLDYAWCVRRVLRRLRPALVVVMETEIWPNLWRESRRNGARLCIVNARISDKAFPKYRKLAWAIGPILNLADRILAQTDGYRARYLQLGADPEKVKTAGNLKYDFDADPAIPDAVSHWLAAMPGARIWIAASTMPPAHAGDVDEDDIVLDAFERARTREPNLLLMLAPRRPERFDRAERILQNRRIPYQRRTRLGQDTALELPGVLLVDTMGELSALFGVTEVVFMGGTLAERGGHNLLEPGFHAKPILSGPNLQNFPEIAEDFRREAALVNVTGSENLADGVIRLLRDKEERLRLGVLASRLARARQGATALVLANVLELWERGVPHKRRAAPLRWVLRSLSLVWRLFVVLDRRFTSVRRLPVPVISIGNLSVGGTGKTPLVVAVAKLLSDQQYQAAILIRGFKRVSRAVVIVQPGEEIDPSLTGDEGQLLIRSKCGPIGIATDRWAVGTALYHRFAPDLFLLDDGFQHWKLARDLDLVVIDVLDQFGGCAVLPEGRLREPLNSLSRAHAFVLMRAEPGRKYTGILETLRRFNATAPVYRCAIRAENWVQASSGQRLELEALNGAKVAAFCGLGNPNSFWKTLSRLPLLVGHRVSFPDHHRYSESELRRLRSLADVLVTTEKDYYNLPPDARRQPGLYWLKIEAHIEDEIEFLTWLESASKARGPRRLRV